uniref:Uncharacterized protein n=1 Tax=Anguilla anguilla TaxID=7936 RepID=A0A0E9PTY0_ANGAN
MHSEKVFLQRMHSCIPAEAPSRNLLIFNSS